MSSRRGSSDGRRQSSGAATERHDAHVPVIVRWFGRATKPCSRRSSFVSGRSIDDGQVEGGSARVAHGVVMHVCVEVVRGRSMADLYPGEHLGVVEELERAIDGRQVHLRVVHLDATRELLC